MAEIIRETNINIASCHALLNALTKRGYLVRTARGKGYTLGPALIAAGQSALEADPLIRRAEAAAEQLGNRLGLGVLLSTIVEDEILAIVARPGPDGNAIGMRRGQRFPLVAPAGAHFVAWATPEEIDAWIQRAGTSTPELLAEWQNALSLVRQRGYQVTLRGTMSSQLASIFSEMARGAQSPSFIERSNDLLHAHAWHLMQPDEIVGNEEYDVAFIASPIFNQTGKPSLSLGVGGFKAKLTGAQIEACADEVMRTCLTVMNEDRRG